jgi:hypothetical protein
MTWSPSTIPTVKARLVDIAEATDWPGARPQLCYGAPAELAREAVIIGDTVDQGEQAFVTITTSRKRDEFYRLDVIVQVIGPGLSQQQATERAFELLGVFELAVRDDPTLGLAEVIVAEIAQPRLNEGAVEGGFGAVVRSGVAIRARI